MNHIEAELHRIEARLAAYPDPFEHAGLYAAQQALRWAAQPEAFAPPYSVVTRRGNEADSKGCSEGNRPPASSNNTGLTVDVA